MKTLRYSTTAFVIGAGIWLCSCSHFTPATLDRYKKGMSIEKVTELSPVLPETEFEITFSNPTVKVKVLVFELALGSYNSVYFLAFKDDKLLYWGYPHEFARVSDPFLNQIGRVAVEEYER
jgi:hypothetical protein